MGTARKAFGHISELLNDSAADLHLPEAPSGCPKRSEGGSPATARRKCVRCTPYKGRPGGASKRLRRRQPPPPPVRYTGIAHTSPALTEPGPGVLHREWRGGVLRRDIGDAERCERHQTGLAEPAKGREGDSPPPLPVRYAGIAHPSPALTEPGPSVSPTRWRGGVLRRDFRGAERCERIFRKRPQGARSEARAGPLRRRGGNIRSTASRTHRAMEDTIPSANPRNQKIKHKSPDSEESGLHLCAILGSNQ